MDSMQHYKLVGLRATCSGRVLGHARNYSQFVKSEQVYVRGLLTDRAACCATIFGVQYDRSCYGCYVVDPRPRYGPGGFDGWRTEDGDEKL